MWPCRRLAAARQPGRHDQAIGRRLGDAVPRGFAGWVHSCRPVPLSSPATGFGAVSPIGPGGVTAGGVIDSLLKTATSDGLLTSKLFARAAAGNGLGTQNVSSGFEFRIPDTSPTGLYGSTLTVTLVSP